MAVQTKGDEGKGMAEERDESAEQQREDERGDTLDYQGPTPPGGGAVTTAGGGFLSVYKPGQGYWTRMCTALAGLLLLVFTCQFIFSTLRTRVGLETKWALLAVGIVAVVALFFGWRYMNKPSVVEFFIGTESEMKKVNWTSRKDLMGSTKVVIVFMFLIAFILFFVDIIFGYIFHLIGVLKQSPFA